MSERHVYQNEEDYEPPRREDEGGEQEAMMDHQSDETRQIIETGGVTPTKGRHTIHCLSIVGQVEGHYILPPQNKTTKYEHVIPQLVAIQEDPDIEGLIMILNTVGGDVEAGLAIAELVASMKKPTVSLVLGGGHSIGVPLAVSARKSFIVPSATMTIHPVRMNGVVLGVPQTLSYFDKMQERITNFVEQNSNMEPDNFRRLMMNVGELVMDVGTTLDGEQAVEEGLIDYLGGLHDAIECLYDMIDEEQARNRNTRRESKKYRSMRKSGYDASPWAVARREEERERPRVRRYPGGRRAAASIENADRWSYGYGGQDGPYTNGSPTGRERQNTPPRMHPTTENHTGQGYHHKYQGRG